MAKSQNGWPVVDKSACSQGPFAGVTFPNGILAGDVAVIAEWMLERYAATVEPIVSGWCWGYDKRQISGSDTWSNHASGTAWDINAPDHPQGPPTSSNMTDKQISACHQIEKDSGGVLRWGGDYTGTPDPMHWEIDKDKSATKAFADRIRAGDVPGGGVGMFLPRKGDEGEPVKFWQNILTWLGFPCEADGIYGDDTERAYWDWRDAHGQNHPSFITGWSGATMIKELGRL